VSRNWRPVYRAYVDPELVRYAQAVLVVSGDFRACAGKYANRALLYVPLEAGHAVQNALLAATERGLGSVQIGGFIDGHLGRLIGSPKGETPLSTVVLGAAGPAVRERQPRFQFDWVDLGDADGRPFYLGVTRLLEAEDRERYCWGRDPDPLAAYDKAAAEGFERLACITPAGLIRGRLGSLRGAIDPREVLSYSPQQYARRRGRLRPFDPGGEYWWKAGIDRISGKKVHVLGELVHYGPTAMRLFGQRCYWSATSSGVAAHLSTHAAFEAALLELIERDAFMRAWLGRAPTPQIAARTFPAPIQGRLRHLEHLGARVMLKALPSDLAAVVLVFAQFEARATTVVTAAAAYNPVMALDKALMETESVVFGSLESGSRAPIRPEEVTAPLDHAALYSQARYFRRADFLAGANGQVRLSELARGKPRHLEALLGRLAAAKRRAVQIDLRFPEAALGNGRVPLYIVRAIVPGLIPITFGFDCEPLGTARVSSHEPLFPHPFS
jgi:thiazole/oxazole-forming peptide maturase SagD family component